MCVCVWRDARVPVYLPGTGAFERDVRAQLYRQAQVLPSETCVGGCTASARAREVLSEMGVGGLTRHGDLPCARRRYFLSEMHRLLLSEMSVGGCT